MAILKDVTINEATYNLANGGTGKITVFMYSGGGEPTKVLDYAVHAYVEEKSHYELVTSSLDNPWMRVVISNINDMVQKQFDPQTDKL